MQTVKSFIMLHGTRHFFSNKCTKHRFIYLLMATFKDLHIENSKNHKRWYCPHHTDCVSMCCLSVFLSVFFYSCFLLMFIMFMGLVAW